MSSFPLAASIVDGPAPWIALVGAIAVLLAVDLLVVRGRGGTLSLRAAAVSSAIFVSIGIAFAGVLLLAGEREAAGAYLAGYLVEKSLSLDNVFVFLLVLSAFGIAEADRHRLLTYGIVGALALRVVMILAGVAALQAFAPVAFVLAALLILTGARLWRDRDDHDAERRQVEKIVDRLPIAKQEHSGRLFAREHGSWRLTVPGAAFAGIAVVDVLFAIDSVPAILAITRDAYLVVAANAFALLGLRPLFHLVAGLMERLYYLKATLAVLLVLIGLKLVAGELIGKIGPAVSLSVVVGTLAVGVVASLLRERRHGRADADAEDGSTTEAVA